MERRTLITLPLLGLLLVGATGCLRTSPTNTNTTTANTAVDVTLPDGSVQKADGTIVKPDGTMMKPDGTTESPDGTMLKPDGTVVKPDGTMVEPTPSTVNTNAAAATKTATYVSYSAAALADAQRAGRAVLYFHAPWCPICNAADRELKTSIGTLPADVTILKTDYDSSTDLKRQYGVTYQHTFVQVDAQGNEVAQWSGGDVASIKRHLK